MKAIKIIVGLLCCLYIIPFIAVGIIYTLSSAGFLWGIDHMEKIAYWFASWDEKK